ncbi:MAG: glycosidase [Paraglaciecola sp.]|jgi:glycosidase
MADKDIAMKPQKRMVLYQMMTRLFSNTNLTNKPWGTKDENGVGTMNEITSKALKVLRKQGYTHIWYTGIIEHALLSDYTAYDIALDDADVVKGRAGSPYAIKDYFDINPDLAQQVEDRMQEFENLVARTHKEGIKVIIDFVPNHVARKYHSDAKPQNIDDFGQKDDTSQSFDPDNNFYYLPGEEFKVPNGYKTLGDYSFPTKTGPFEESPAKASGNNVFLAQPSVFDWFETIKLNYGVDLQNSHQKHFDPIPDTWIKMKEILLYWCEKKVDGFRCDMAEMVPVEFWRWVTDEVKKTYPDVLFIAEVYQPEAYRTYIHDGGFDYLYDKVEMYDTLKAIVQGKSSADHITQVWQQQEGIGQNMLRFLENHDEQRIASPEFAGDMRKGIPMMAASAFMHEGPIMMYFGQDVGEPALGLSGFSGDDGRTTIFDYWGVPEHIKWVNNGKFDGGQLSADQKTLQKDYLQIIQIINQKRALQIGAFFDLQYFNRCAAYTGYSDGVYSFLRYIDDERLLVVINFKEESEAVQIKIPELALEMMKLDRQELVFSFNTQVLTKDQQDLSNHYIGSAVMFNVPALQYIIVSINNK